MDYKDEYRNSEARELIDQIDADAQRKMRANENGNDWRFFSDTVARFEQYGPKARVSQKQLFWLRDLRDRYAL